MDAKKPKEFTPGLFGYNVPADGSSSASIPKKQKAFEEADQSNPMVRGHGRHPDLGLRCKDCDFLLWKQFAKKYFKCSHRGNTSGPATDHRKHWPACTKLEPFDKSKPHQIV